MDKKNEKNEETLGLGESASRPPPPKTLRALGTRPVGLRLSLPNGSDTVAQAESKSTPEGHVSGPITPPEQSFTALSAHSSEHMYKATAPNVSYYDVSTVNVQSNPTVKSWMAPEADAAMEVG